MKEQYRYCPSGGVLAHWIQTIISINEEVRTWCAANTTRRIIKWGIAIFGGALERRNMSVKIKISYNTDEELEQIRKLLSPVFKNIKISRNKEGRYKKAYAEINN